MQQNYIVVSLLKKQAPPVAIRGKGARLSNEI
jgi:hypothetical protein